MKTKLFFGLLLCLAFCACEVEREQEITQPNIQPLKADFWSDLEAPDTQIEVFDQRGPFGSLTSGLLELRVTHPNESRTEYFIGPQIQEFYHTYTNAPPGNSPTAKNEQEAAEPKTTKGDQRNQDHPLKLIQYCDGHDCQFAVKQEISRLQKIARLKCLSMVASFNCCQRGNSQEIMVYLTPGVYCERKMNAQIQAKTGAKNQ